MVKNYFGIVAEPFFLVAEQMSVHGRLFNILTKGQAKISTNN